MMGFVLLTLAFTLAILLAGIISTIILIKLMGNQKFINWLMNHYMVMIEKSFNSFDDDLKDLGV